MIHIDSIEWVRDAWEVRSRIEEGVYQLQDYPVRITHLGTQTMLRCGMR